MKTNWTRVCGRTPAKSPRGRKRRRRGTQTRMPPNYPGSGAAAPIGQRETWRCYLRTTPYALTAARRRAQSRLHRCRIPRKGAGVRACHRSDCSPPHLDLRPRRRLLWLRWGRLNTVSWRLRGRNDHVVCPFETLKDLDLLKKKKSRGRKASSGEPKRKSSRVKIDTRNISIHFQRSHHNIGTPYNL